jgi:hypothetical protein
VKILFSHRDSFKRLDIQHDAKVSVPQTSGHNCSCLCDLGIAM